MNPNPEVEGYSYVNLSMFETLGSKSNALHLDTPRSAKIAQNLLRTLTFHTAPTQRTVGLPGTVTS